MANDLSDTVRDALGSMVREAIKNVGDASPSKSGGGGSPFSGAKGLAAGAGLAAAAPLAKKGFDAVRGNGGLPTPSPARAVKKVASKASPKDAVSKAASKAGDKVGSNLKDAVTSKVDEAGGAGGLVKEAASGLLPGVGGDRRRRKGRYARSWKRPADAGTAGCRCGRAPRDGLQPVDAVRGLARVHASRDAGHAGGRLHASASPRRSGGRRRSSRRTSRPSVPMSASSGGSPRGSPTPASCRSTSSPRA